jgi:putative ABC transport system permease protein
MRRFVASQLRHRPTRVLSLGVAILVTSVSFVLLAAAARTSGLKVTGSVKSNFRPAYDILVRPKGSKTPLENERGLVRDNYLSGIFGGISLDQWHEIEAMPGVEVAAPIANVGYVLFNGAIPFSIDRFVNRDPYQLYRLRYSWIADNGKSIYPNGADYIYYNRIHPFTSVLEGGSPSAPKEVVPGQGLKDVCVGFGESRPFGSGPFYVSESLHCYSAKSPAVNRNNFYGIDPAVVPDGIGAFQSGYYPILLAAIDPAQEQRLLGLSRAVVSGRYLNEADRVFVHQPKVGAGRRFVPVLASERVYARETLRVDVERLSPPRPAQVPELLTAGLCRVTLRPCPRGLTEPAPRGWPSDTTAYSFLSSLRGTVVGHERFPISAGYRELLSGGQTVRGAKTTFSSNYWTVSETEYRSRRDGSLEPRTTTNPPEVWTNPAYGILTGGFWPAPPENKDLQFRRLKGFAGSNRFLPHNVYATPDFSIVGRYDPAKLPGFSPLSKVPLETYYPPLLEPLGAASTKALGGRPLSPTQNVGDYIQQPPLMLTTIGALEAFSNPRYFFTRPPLDPKAPLSVIRVRVAGVTGPDDRSQARIRSVALRIHDRTGLDVDITAGSSPHRLTVDLPPGKFGRPALTLGEGWAKKGVSAAFLHGVGRKQLALFTLIPLLCCLFLGNGTYAAARARRAEIGTLLTLGWSRAAIFSVILGEVVVIASAAGLLGVALAAALIGVLSLHAQLWVTLLVLPLALLIALAAGLVPAWRASLLDPLAALRPPVADIGRSHEVRRVTQLALLNLRRVPGRALVGGAGLLLGACALTVLLAVQAAFQGVLAGTLLGDAIAIQIRGFDYLAVALVIALAALSIADVMYLNLRERQTELVTLRTLGWGRYHLLKLVSVEGFALALAASLLGAIAGVAICTAFLAVPVSSLLVGAFSAVAGGIAAALLASVLPLSQLERLTPPTVLAADE